jgi:hypothetical protein
MNDVKDMIDTSRRVIDGAEISGEPDIDFKVDGELTMALRGGCHVRRRHG